MRLRSLRAGERFVTAARHLEGQVVRDRNPNEMRFGYGVHVRLGVENEHVKLHPDVLVERVA